MVYSYVNSLYFITGTMSSVGYGDNNNKGKDIVERIFLMITIFLGIAVFSIIKQQVLSYRIEPTLDLLVKQNIADVTDYLYRLSAVRK